MTDLGPQRRKVVVLAACIACMASGPILLKGNHVLQAGWVVVMILLLVFVGIQYAKLKKEGS
jgi:phosphatidylglycerophosphate synthase